MWRAGGLCICVYFKFYRVEFLRENNKIDKIWQRYRKNKNGEFFATQCSQCCINRQLAYTCLIYWHADRGLGKSKRARANGWLRIHEHVARRRHYRLPQYCRTVECHEHYGVRRLRQNVYTYALCTAAISWHDVMEVMKTSGLRSNCTDDASVNNSDVDIRVDWIYKRPMVTW